MTSAPPYLRINHTVKYICRKISEEYEQCADDRDRQKQRHITPQSGINRRLSESRIGKYLFYKDGAPSRQRSH